jgi:hypothetical protein
VGEKAYLCVIKEACIQFKEKFAFNSQSHLLNFNFDAAKPRKGAFVHRNNNNEAERNLTLYYYILLHLINICIVKMLMIHLAVGVVNW